ncbi:hypothetical protein ACVGVM_00670 [Pseudonocardia bannensis]|uniref:Uncharacterized protein n=1 Tax=Pseudonocardia bannensis TaxID=630973 RepID=A0A848DB75_9PSEU|nr:hypothetical protein [Pseudonocardia bannensis]NMH90112.1 hypothetical protein [Pseudonocardia bannensis]
MLKIALEASAVLVTSAALAWSGGIGDALTRFSPPRSAPASCVDVNVPGVHVAVGRHSPPVQHSSPPRNCIDVRVPVGNHSAPVGRFSPPVQRWSPPARCVTVNVPGVHVAVGGFSAPVQRSSPPANCVAVQVPAARHGLPVQRWSPPARCVEVVVPGLPIDVARHSAPVPC